MHVLNTNYVSCYSGSSYNLKSLDNIKYILIQQPLVHSFYLIMQSKLFRCLGVLINNVHASL